MTDEELFERLRASRRPEDHKRLEFLQWLKEAADVRADPRNIDHALSDKYFFRTTREANDYFGTTETEDDEE